MLHTVSEKDFLRLMLTKEFADDSRTPMAAEAYRILFTRWAEMLSVAELALMGYLISRTLSVGKLAQRIAMVEFTQGTREDGKSTGCGISLGKTALRDHLKRLSDAGLLQIYRTVSGPDAHEKESRMFEIDCKQLLDWEFPGQNQTVFSIESAKNGVRNPDTPLRNPDTPSYIHSMYSSSISNKDKSLYSARGSRSLGVEGKPMLAVPKKTRAVVTQTGSAADIVASVKAKAVAVSTTRIARAASKPAHMIDKLEMQAMIDTSQKRLAPSTTRMVVTGKEFGLLRKRLREQPPASLAKFFDWLFTYWGTISLQHRTALKRNTTRTERGETGLPASPDFHALCYRYPYFLKSYANFVAERTDDKAQEVTDTRLSAMEERLRVANRDKAMLQSALAAEKERNVIRRVRPTGLVAPTPTTKDVDLLDATELPEWQTRNTFGVRKNA